VVNTPEQMHSTAARGAIVTASIYTALLQLFSATSLAYRAAGDSWLIDLMNVGVLAVAGVAAADLLWRDILHRGLIWPSFDPIRRHHICVSVFSALSAAFAVRAFVAAGEISSSLQVGAYYLLMCGWPATEAAAIAHEKREEAPCPPASNKD